MPEASSTAPTTSAPATSGPVGGEQTGRAASLGGRETWSSRQHLPSPLLRVPSSQSLRVSSSHRLIVSSSHRLIVSQSPSLPVSQSPSLLHSQSPSLLQALARPANPRHLPPLARARHPARRESPRPAAPPRTLPRATARRVVSRLGEPLRSGGWEIRGSRSHLRGFHSALCAIPCHRIHPRVNSAKPLRVSL